MSRTKLNFNTRFRDHKNIFINIEDSSKFGQPASKIKHRMKTKYDAMSTIHYGAKFIQIDILGETEILKNSTDMNILNENNRRHNVDCTLRNQPHNNQYLRRSRDYEEIN
jgi:hypothetical protein